MAVETCTHVVGTGIPKNVIQSLILRDIFRRLPDHHSKLDLVIRQMFLDRLCDSWNRDRRPRRNESRSRLVEQDRKGRFS